MLTIGRRRVHMSELVQQKSTEYVGPFLFIVPHGVDNLNQSCQKCSYIQITNGWDYSRMAENTDTWLRSPWDLIRYHFGHLSHAFQLYSPGNRRIATYSRVTYQTKARPSLIPSDYFRWTLRCSGEFAMVFSGTPSKVKMRYCSKHYWPYR